MIESSIYFNSKDIDTFKIYSFNSNSTGHKDITERLEEINPSLASETRKVLDVNKAERHIRGGLATKEKYMHQHMYG